MDKKIPEAVSIEVTCIRIPSNPPGRVGRKGWWNFELQGEDFSVRPGYCSEISPVDAEAKAKVLCERLGLAILSVRFSLTRLHWSPAMTQRRANDLARRWSNWLNSCRY